MLKSQSPTVALCVSQGLHSIPEDCLQLHSLFIRTTMELFAQRAGMSESTLAEYYVFKKICSGIQQWFQCWCTEGRHRTFTWTSWTNSSNRWHCTVALLFITSFQLMSDKRNERDVGCVVWSVCSYLWHRSRRRLVLWEQRDERRREEGRTLQCPSDRLWFNLSGGARHWLTNTHTSLLSLSLSVSLSLPLSDTTHTHYNNEWMIPVGVDVLSQPSSVWWTACTHTYTQTNSLQILHNNVSSDPPPSTDSPRTLFLQNLPSFLPLTPAFIH